MGRPRILKTKEGGQVVLKNIDASLTEKLEALINGSTESSLPPGTIVGAGPAFFDYSIPSATSDFDDVEDCNLTCVAVGTYKGKDGWYVTEVGYNPETGEAKLISNVRVGDMKAYAIDSFKKKAVTNNLV